MNAALSPSRGTPSWQHELLAPLRLAAYEPMLFWRHRWHWPWWDAGTFDRAVTTAAANITSQQADVETDSCDPGAATSASPLHTLAVREQPHPVVWAAEEMAARLRCRCEIAPIARDEAEHLSPDRAARTPERAGFWRVENAGDPAGEPHLAVSPDPHARGVVPPVVVAPEEPALQVDNQWIAASRIRAAAAALLEHHPRSTAGRPAVLLSGGSASWASRLAMAWGAELRACWLFGDRSDYWVDDLIWARPHALFASRSELLALLQRSEKRSGRRRLLRALSRLEVAVFDAPSPTGTQAGGAPAMSPGVPPSDLHSLRELLAQRRRAPPTSMGALEGGEWRHVSFAV